MKCKFGRRSKLYVPVTGPAKIQLVACPVTGELVPPTESTLVKVRRIRKWYRDTLPGKHDWKALGVTVAAMS